MTPRRLPSVSLIFLAAGLLAIACTPQPKPNLARGAALVLTTFSESGVEVVIRLQRASDGQVFLAATFTPLQAGFHLYSKDIPRNGVNGLGRPTLLELTSNSKMQGIGALMESAAAGVSSADPTGVLVYPAGPVTLSLRIKLPAGNGWTTDEVSVTYMACSANGCKAPVMGKAVPVKVPGMETISK